MKPGTLKDIASITLRLTITCVLAGLIMGITFVLTHDAKVSNESARDARVMRELLGYGEENPAPDSMQMHVLYRYVISRGEGHDAVKSVGYALPQSADTYIFVELDLEGRFVEKYDLDADAKKMRSEGDRSSAVTAAVNSGMRAPGTVSAAVRYADSLVIVTENGARTAYILDGRYPGFKTFIRVKLALDAEYAMLGFEVLEHEEDPGLGAEIVQPWFRGQFAGRSFEQLKSLDVVREPLPDDYRDAMTGKKDPQSAEKIRAEHAGDPIYALTGATISSRSVLNGNKSLVKKFVYRMEALDRVLAEQKIDTPFGAGSK